MTGTSAKRESLGIIGIGAAACVACCAGPILAFLSGLTIAGVSSTLVIGVAGLGLAAVAAAAWLILRRRGRHGCADAPTSEPVQVSAPTIRGPR